MNIALRNISTTQALERFSDIESDFSESYNNLKSSHKKLKKKSYVERKIKSIKRRIFE